MRRLILYTKDNCRLCQEAQQIIRELDADFPLQVDLVNIADPDHASHAATYGQRIPVLGRPDTKLELDWPFSAADVKAYLAR